MIFAPLLPQKKELSLKKPEKQAEWLKQIEACPFYPSVQ